jgi:hypothetical protein
MGKGVDLNKNTYNRMIESGLTEFVVEDHNRQYCYSSDKHRFTLQIREGEDNTPTYFNDIQIMGDPLDSIERFHLEHPRIPPMPDRIKIKRSWKNVVKRRFWMNKWPRR